MYCESDGFRCGSHVSQTCQMEVPSLGAHSLSHWGSNNLPGSSLNAMSNYVNNDYSQIRGITNAQSM
eukprot:6008631-Amphidinium_carterae.1